MVILEIEKLAQSYGALKVLTDISFSLQAGDRAALIGPNGAGKTTLFNVISGFTPPSAGQITLLGQDVTHMPTHTRVSLGLARSFQISNLFPELSLLNNVLLAIQGIQTTRYQMFRQITANKDNLTKAQALLELIGLWEKRDDLISVLGHGEQRQMEIILSLATGPKI